MNRKLDEENCINMIVEYITKKSLLENSRFTTYGILEYCYIEMEEQDGYSDDIKQTICDIVEKLIERKYLSRCGMYLKAEVNLLDADLKFLYTPLNNDDTHNNLICK
ncbi:MAG: hypothetical protein IJ358_02435 [Clostridia bacterium]|nr:hypothetical protein [Clostridia bacterium]